MRKSLLLLFVAFMTAFVANAEGLTEGKDYKWVKVKSSMTTVPADFCEGVSAEAATAKADSEWASTIYGNLPEEGGAFSVAEYSWIGSSLTTKTWEQILAAVEDFDEYLYPAKIERPADAPVLGVDFEWVQLTAENTTAPTDICAGVLQDDAQFELSLVYGTGAIFGELPEEGGNYNVLYDDWGAVDVKSLSWAQIAVLASDEWEAIYYPRSLGTSAIKNTSIDNNKVKKMVENGQVVIIKNGKKYSVSGELIK